MSDKHYLIVNDEGTCARVSSLPEDAKEAWAEGGYHSIIEIPADTEVSELTFVNEVPKFVQLTLDT